MPTPVARALLRTAEIISRGWTQGWLARLPSGQLTYLGDPRATHFHLMGALYLAAQESVLNPNNVDWAALARIRRELNGADPYRWNDAPGRTAQEVIDLCLRAASHV